MTAEIVVRDFKDGDSCVCLEVGGNSVLLPSVYDEIYYFSQLGALAVAKWWSKELNIPVKEQP